MTTDNDRPAADMTTDELAAEIRRRMGAHTADAAALTDVASRLAAQLRDRLPYLDPADCGAVLINIGAYMTDALRLFTGYGLDPAAAGQAVANVVAIAGQQLYGETATPAATTGD
jgi:hypothetical protein